MTGFKNFILRGNLVELAVAFIMAAPSRRRHGDRRRHHGPDRQGRRHPDFSNYKPGGLPIGAWITAVISFVVIAAVVYFFDREALHGGQGAVLPQPRAGHPGGRQAAAGDPRPARGSGGYRGRSRHRLSEPNPAPDRHRRARCSAVVRRHLAAQPPILASSSASGAASASRSSDVVSGRTSPNTAASRRRRCHSDSSGRLGDSGSSGGGVVAHGSTLRRRGRWRGCPPLGPAPACRSSAAWSRRGCAGRSATRPASPW